MNRSLSFLTHIRPTFIGALLLAVLGLAAVATTPGPAVASGAVESLAGCTSQSIPRNDDGSSQAVPLPFSPNFFGDTYNQLWVNNNGNVTFDGPLSTFTPDPILDTNQVIIAPFWADVDTRGTASSLVTYGSAVYGDRPAFCANWVNVGYYASHTDKLNSFQLLLVERSDIGAGDFDIVMNYDRVQWETGDASGGTGGLGGDSARMGYSNGVDEAFEWPGSDVDGAFLDGSGAGLANNSRNSFVTGRYIFEVRNGAPPAGGTVSGVVVGSAQASVGAPAGLGTPIAGSIVTACAIPPCFSTVSNADGEFTLAGLPPGDYHLIAYPPGDRVDLLPGDVAFDLQADEVLDVGPVVLAYPILPPAGVTIQSIGTIGGPGGTPVIRWDVPTGFSVPGCADGIATFELRTPGGVLLDSGPMTEGPPGTYSGTIDPLIPYHGPARVTVDIDCPDGPDEQVIFDVYIDPSGYVRTVQGDPIEGATVTLYRSDSAGGPFAQVPDGSGIMSPSNRTNPDLTDADGFFHWDVVAGYYKVRAEKDGCVDPFNADIEYVETPVMEIPPPVTDLDIRLDCGGGGGQEVMWGDWDCDGGVSSRDNQALSRYVLQQVPLSQTQPCPTIGSPVQIDGFGQEPWGNADCDNDGITTRDNQATLRRVLEQNPLSQTEPCPDVGTTVTVG
jgi:hypothetical protein